MIFDLLMITTIVCFIIDISGVIDSIESMLSRWVNKPLKLIKPFSCSLCMSFWIGLLWVICVDFSLFNLFILSLIVTCSPQITNTIVIIRMLINKVQDTITTYINK